MPVRLVMPRKLQGVGFPHAYAVLVGQGGKQIQLEDPDGNPIELFEPAD